MAIGEVTAKNIGAIFATVRELVSTDKPFYQPWSQIAQPHQVEPIWTCPSARLPHPQRECTWGHLQPGNCPYCGVELEHRSLRVWLLQCGRSGGKSRTGAEWITDRARRFPGTRWAAIGINARHVRSVLIEGDSGLLSCAPPNFQPGYEPTKSILTYPNNSKVEAFYSEAAYLLRGPQFHGAWGDEISSWVDAGKGDVQDSTWNNLMLATRLRREGLPTQIVATSTPRPVQLVKDIRAYPFVHVTLATLFDNSDYLDPAYVDQIRLQYAGTRLERQEVFGELLEDNPDAFWQRIWIETSRINFTCENPEEWYDKFCEEYEIRRVVVAVDPAVSQGERACEHGIIVCALGSNGHGYVLADGSCSGGPEIWSAKAVQMYNEFRADVIVAERNQGGDMVASTIRTVSPNVPVALVVATRGKAVRAEPVANLYQQGRIHHVGVHKELEDQQCIWDPQMKGQPADRIDATVWGITHLMPSITSGGLKIHRRMN
ncbi:MAG TPA: ATP-binding protein [Candidatus Omnitrophica bacterium]|nr:ATP-binding protein [Candidatus Omnitrophota bacterium]